MKIKKLELCGFKSFVDKTILHFDHDVLGIVGPNGCGKSNIVDAIRWCMGEQSARHLRGRSMEDVIFNGSDSRAAHDFAEVTITFDNDDPTLLPLEYKDYAEIAVTRRLHRTGESEYLVNKTQVRLKDVTDLFLGTGAGTKAYGVIEQGKIGVIVSAKPEDRRLLIEEAAGITKFKSRKKQAERKMELTQQNLLRVGDIVAEIERNLVSLKRQAAKAERYETYRNELEDLQLHEAAHRYLELVGYVRMENEQVATLGRASEEARGELAAREAEIEVARLEVHAAEEALEGAQNASFGAENAVRVEEAAIERAKDRLASLRQREQQAEGERHEMDGEAARLAGEREVVARDVAALEDEETSQRARIQDEETKLTTFESAHTQTDASVNERRQTIARSQAEIASTEAALAALARRQQEMAARLEKVRGERATLDQTRADDEARAAELARVVEDLRAGRSATSVEKAKLEQRLAELKEAIANQERSLDDAKGDLATKRSRLAALEEMHARLDGVGAGTKALVATRDGCIEGLVADRIEAPEELTHALAGLLGTRLQDVVVRDLERGMELLATLAQERQGRATIVPAHAPFVAGSRQTIADDEGVVGPLADRLGYAPSDEALVRSLVGDAIVVRDSACARRLRAAGVHAAAVVTIDGTVLHADGRVSGGQGDDLAAGILDSKREARHLVEEVRRLESVAAQRFEDLRESRVEIARIGALLDQARREAHERELALVTADKDLQKTQAEMAAAARRLGALVEEEGELARAIEASSQEREETARVLGEAQACARAAEDELRQAETALAEARERLETQRQTLTACKVAIAGTRERLAAARASDARLTRSSADLDERARRLQDEMTASARTFGETAAQWVAHREQLAVALDAARAAQDELARVRADHDALRTSLAERDAALRDLRARVESVREELRTHEMSLREKQLALEHLLGGVADRFRGLHLPHVIGDYHLRPAPDEVTRARTEELLRLIERMGSVNLDAKREYAEEEARFATLTTQKADLEKALADLHRAIGQMNRESRRLFQETFDAVNERFREIFPRMFRGGRAELRMTNPDDLLETGIDIVAQPPGKKLSSIELMSGGEKALTAVSLIFAIFQIKPSPFCVLDEVDAPLDEANVARYNDLVRSMTDRSQFILITHVKRTMQSVDVLYGVTMGEPGVSKIVSVKINESAVAATRTHGAGPEVAVA